MSSPLEFSSYSAKRFPHYLRQQLKKDGWEVFNPRGESLERVESTELLAGLILEILDPNKTIENSMTRLPSRVKSSFHKWRKAVKKCKDPFLEEFLDEWKKNKKKIHLLELLYELVILIPEDDENSVRLEAITRTINQTSLFASYQGIIIPNDQESLREVFWNLLVPLATGAIEVDEELLLDEEPPQDAPHNRVNIMSIHQAKGLEFPLVIVDVGSDFRQNYTAQEFKRFPKAGGKPCNMEDGLRTCSPLEEPQRTSRDRAFDDLTRQYFVAFSRPQDVLVLVGLKSVKDGYNTKQGHGEIANVATGWSRDGNWHWKRLKNIKHI
ncbi:MAG: hypothetical protein BME94_08495 [Methanobacteriales archaeon Met13]